MNISRESLLDDFSAMLTEAEDLLKRAGNETGERAKDLRAQVEAKLLSTTSSTTIRGARSASPRSSGSSPAC